MHDDQKNQKAEAKILAILMGSYSIRGLTRRRKEEENDGGGTPTQSNMEVMWSNHVRLHVVYITRHIYVQNE